MRTFIPDQIGYQIFRKDKLATAAFEEPGPYRGLRVVNLSTQPRHLSDLPGINVRPQSETTVFHARDYPQIRRAEPTSFQCQPNESTIHHFHGLDRK